MQFFKTIRLAIYSPQFYSGIFKKSFKQSLGYFLLLTLLLTAIHLITLINPLLIEAPKSLQKIVQQVVNCYPKDLEIKITGGHTISNQQEPYFISNCDPSAGEQKLVVIDTKNSFSAQKFNEYKVEAWVTKDSIFYKKNNLETSSYNLVQIKDFKLNQETLKSYSNMITPWLKFVGPVLLLLAFGGIYLTYIFRLIYLALLAILIWGLSKLFKQTLTYGSSYKTGLYAITLGLVIELIYGFPFMVTIITLGVVWINLLWPKRA
ncbi:MAG: Uncharacterized protein G01um10147_558 [Microgenomates group bacterium Gr01-1014_7]|nr:MAG: Uncharacterized protein G01um10147_558 [Microgenomates group bacterium Gr01-1014_7]